MTRHILPLFAAAVLAGCSSGSEDVVSSTPPSPSPLASPAAGLDRIEHIVVIYMENRSFDSLYGLFPGANGIANATRPLQRDLAGNVLSTLPQPLLGTSPDPRFPANMPVLPFNIEPFVPANSGPSNTTGVPIHQFYQQQSQINGGALDYFVAWGGQVSSGAPQANGLVMGYYDAQQLALGPLAKEFTLCDNWFHSAFGGSFLNHQWLVAARTPPYQVVPTDPAPPASQTAVLAADGQLVGNYNAICTPDGLAVNTCFSTQLPPPGVNPVQTIPPQRHDCIADRLTDQGVPWAWYSEGWDQTLAGNPPSGFQFHHQPIAYFARFAPRSALGKQHLLDLTNLEADLEAGRPLRQVNFVKFAAPFNEHPGEADVVASEQRAANLVGKIRRHPDWSRTAIIVTYDENGGFYDHVPPPKPEDAFGPGMRIPALIISPFARKGFVDHNYYETCSIMKLIEQRFRLAPVATRDATCPSMASAFDFQQ